KSDILLEGEAGDCSGGVWSYAGQLEQSFDGARELTTSINDSLGGSLQVDRTAVVAESLPGADHVGDGCLCQRMYIRPAFHPGMPIRQHAIDLCLLQHDLADHDR